MHNNKKIKLALICTKGGHFEQMLNLLDFYSCYRHFWITNKSKQTETQLKNEKAYFIDLAHFSKPWTYLTQLAPVIKIFARERPTHVLSTGSGRTALVPFLLARTFGLRFLHIDTFSRVHGHSKFGTFLLRTGNRIYTQWEDPGNGKAVYIGPVFKQQEQERGKAAANGKYVFVTVGTREEPFLRLIQGVEVLIKKGVIRENVVIQAGSTRYRPAGCEVFDFCGPERIDALIRNASYVITQESAGIGTQCLKHRTRFLVMPREYRFGELPVKSDMKEDLHLRLEELGYTRVVTDTAELEQAIRKIRSLKTGFDFNNTLAISTLHKAMEEA